MTLSDVMLSSTDCVSAPIVSPLIAQDYFELPSSARPRRRE
jgi:hypothetical protein